MKVKKKKEGNVVKKANINKVEKGSFVDKVKKWIPLFGLSLAMAIIVIDGTIMNVSIKYIMSDLGITLQEIQTIMTTYTLVVAALTITGGRLGDLFGYKKMFKLGAVIFGIGALIASFSTTGGILIFGWAILEGIGAALMTPLAFALWGATAGASAAFGPILGGYLTTNYSWRWAFRINILVVLTLIATTILIKEYIVKSSKKYIDFLGVLLSSGGIALITYGIIKSSDHGWIVAKKAMDILGYEVQPFGYSAVIFMIIAGLLVLTGFLFWEKFITKTGKTPLVNFDIFKDKTFSSGILTGAVTFLGQAGLIFSIPIFFQSVLKLDAFETGIGILPLSLAILVAAPSSMKIANKIRPKYIIQLGLIISLIGTYILYSTIDVTAVRSDFIPGLIVFGLGLGLVMAQITNLTLSKITAGQAGEASGLNSTARQLGQTFGTAIIGSVFLTAMSTSLVDSIKVDNTLPMPIQEGIVKLIEEDPSSLQFGAEEKFKEIMEESAMPSMPEGMDMANMPEGMDMTNVPEGMDIANMPEDMSMDNMPEGMDIANMSDDMIDPSKLEDMSVELLNEVMPEGMDMANMPEGMSMDNIPEGMGMDSMQEGMVMLSLDPAELVSKISDAANQASVDGAKNALMYTGIFYLLSLVVSTLLSNQKIEGDNKTVVAAH